jgi:hypothetical protein
LAISYDEMPIISAHCSEFQRIQLSVKIFASSRSNLASAERGLTNVLSLSLVLEAIALPIPENFIPIAGG